MSTLTSKDYYFDSYAHFGIHEEMLKDEVRTLTYRNAIIHNKHLFKDKIVLDVGCGTGILSMFSARAGAKHVYGVDMSNIIDQAQNIIEENGLSDIITLIKGKVEEVTLPVPQVDIIISEWMGYFLLYESMLDTVLVARDRFLAPNGFLFPDKASLYIAAIEDGQYREEKIDFWDNVYGFKMSVIKKMALHEPLVDTCDEKALVTTAYACQKLDLKTMTKEEVTFSKKEFRIKVLRDDFVHAFVCWFDVIFSACHKSIGFTTAPFSKYTHWKQTIFYLPETLLVKNGDEIIGTVSCQPNAENTRDLEIDIEYEHAGLECTARECVRYKMR